MRRALLVLKIACLQTSAFACRCADQPRTFLTSLGELTAEFEVVRIDTVLTKNTTATWSAVILKLKVVRSFGGEWTVDHVWMDNNSGSDCRQGLFPDSIGQRYILTGRLITENWYNLRYNAEDDRPFLDVTTCGETLLEVDGDHVYGSITENMQARYLAKYLPLKEQDEAKAEAYRMEVAGTRHHPDHVQEMPIEVFYRLMDERTMSAPVKD